MKRSWLVALGLVVLAGLPAAALAGAETVGRVAFANSGEPAAQAPFLRGLALLHNFEYERAAAAFREAEAADPSFAMAYWGEAMTHNHPVWMEQDLTAARAALARLGPTPEARAAKAATQRERDYLGAVEILFGEGAKFERDLRYADAMARIHAAYPGDVDAAAFDALALLGSAHAGRDFAIYMKSAAILEEAFPAHPDHPGVLHYLIHSYDDPIHAPLGLRAARRYGKIAPDAGHALHMTSHIFVALGMWDDVVAANRQAIGVVNAQRAAAGKAPSWCGHYPAWLVYGYLQKKMGAAARELAGKCLAQAPSDPRTAAESGADPDNTWTDSWLFMRAMIVADGGRPPVADGLGPDRWSTWSQLSDAYARLLAAAAESDRASLGDAAADLARITPLLLDELDKAGAHDPSARAMVEAMRLQGKALVELGGGNASGALATLEAAASVEEGAPLEFGPPAVAKPSRELLGDVLSKLGRRAEAAAAYRAALARMPGRRLSVEGLALAEAAR